MRKFYILVQFAFWLQQMMVINMEKRRKDHWQMFTHHIVTSALIFASYGYHQTKVANLILCTMDVVDLFLPVSIGCLLLSRIRDVLIITARPPNASNTSAMRLFPTSSSASSCSLGLWRDIFTTLQYATRYGPIFPRSSTTDATEAVTAPLSGPSPLRIASHTS